ncbi:hypothetical protein [Lentibacillus sediminis]|uniref:hypothetical protein n=1 Tax=Lentibacillus sediminis TaxID=1940529 RepID=UPI00195A3DD8|nr:hypothetical protein [Lentibacillus sediminis]
MPGKVCVEGEQLEVTIEKGHIVLTPVITIEKEQACFCTEEWQKGEREAEEDIKAGRVKKFDYVEDLIADLESEDGIDDDEILTNQSF